MILTIPGVDPSSTMLSLDESESSDVKLRRFRAEISVYDSGDKASFVLLGYARTERTRRQASDLLDNYLGGILNCA
ncbi:unnamed protein product [Brassica rapa]|uniref:Uncharacterized protein n=2 Tax=Brassica TaxID=3705 RepID=A0A3P6AYL2_BRACM|nr:unnamed protein product [Brassica napus]CAG7902805.1 unnamed protein product [Brassica rapa]VDC99246.1 unnamed protein product [Brassica rapa]